MSEANKALVRCAWAAPDNPDIIDEVYAPDLLWHEPDQDIQGSEQAKQFIAMYKTAFPRPEDNHRGPDSRRGQGRCALDVRRYSPGRDRGVWPSHWQADGA